MTSITAFVTYGRGGAGARVRVFDWLDRVSPDAAVHPYLGTGDNSPATLLRNPAAAVMAEARVHVLARRTHDRLLLFRQASPFGKGRIETRLLQGANWGVYDFDDGLPWDGGQRARVGRLVRSSAQKCVQSVVAADRVIAGNEYLAEWASQHCHDVVVIPSCIEPGDYVVKEDYEIGNVPRLVWIGSLSGEPYLERIADPLLQLHQKLGARLTIIGDPAGRLSPALEAMTDRLAWQNKVAERQLAAFDVGLAPLTDDRFSRGKSAYKLLQYAAAGVPFVASSVGTNETVATALGGMLATNEAEWVERVTELAETSASSRAVLASRALQVVTAHYSFDAWEGRWRTAMELHPFQPLTGS